MAVFLIPVQIDFSELRVWTRRRTERGEEPSAWVQIRLVSGEFGKIFGGVSREFAALHKPQLRFLKRNQLLIWSPNRRRQTALSNSKNAVTFSSACTTKR
jgi:hypothetical protein